MVVETGPCGSSLHTEHVNWVNEVVIPLLAATASMLGILVALDQVTAMPRLRRQSTFWRELRQSSLLARDAEVYQSLEREANARVIAFQALPARKLLFPAFTIALGIYTAWQVGYSAGSIPPDGFSWNRVQEKAAESGLDVPLVVVIPSITLFGLVGWINVLVERNRITNAYLEGQTIDRWNVRAQGDHWPATKVMGVRGTFALFLFGLGALCLSAGFGASAGLRDQQAPPPIPPWAALLLFGGVPLFMAGLLVYSRVAAAITEAWVHPRPLTQHARTNRTRSDHHHQFRGKTRMPSAGRTPLPAQKTPGSDVPTRPLR
jgi:hypothetical protein